MNTSRGDQLKSCDRNATAGDRMFGGEKTIHQRSRQHGTKHQRHVSQRRFTSPRRLGNFKTVDPHVAADATPTLMKKAEGLGTGDQAKSGRTHLMDASPPATRPEVGGVSHAKLKSRCPRPSGHRRRSCSNCPSAAPGRAAGSTRTRNSGARRVRRIWNTNKPASRSRSGQTISNGNANRGRIGRIPRADSSASLKPCSDFANNIRASSAAAHDGGFYEIKCPDTPTGQPFESCRRQSSIRVMCDIADLQRRRLV